MGTYSLEKALGYSFKNNKLLLQALTHSSYSPNNYQRLEFVGDALLKSIVAAELYRICRKASEGFLTRATIQLTSNSFLAKLSGDFNLENYARLGRGEKYLKDSIKADMIESIIAAIYFDGGYNKTRKTVLSWLKPHLKSFRNFEELKDPKTRLCEYAQKHDIPLPAYAVVSITGSAHHPIFTVLGKVAGLSKKGKGGSHKAAEQEAAKVLLGALEKSDSV